MKPLLLSLLVVLAGCGEDDGSYLDGYVAGRGVITKTMRIHGDRLYWGEPGEDTTWNWVKFECGQGADVMIFEIKVLRAQQKAFRALVKELKDSLRTQGM